MRLMRLKIVFLLLSVRFASTRYLSDNQLTIDGNQSADQRTEHAGNGNFNKEDYSKELDALSKSGYASNQGAEENNEGMIVRQLMVMIRSYQTTKEENDLGVNKAVPNVGEIMSKDTSETLKVKKNKAEDQSQVSEDRRQGMAEDSDNISQIKTDLVGETAKFHIREENDWPIRRDVELNGRSAGIKDTFQMPFDGDNDGIPKNNENANEESHSRDISSSGRDEISCGNESKIEVSKDGNYQSKTTNKQQKGYGNRFGVPQENNNTFNDTKYNSAINRGENYTYQVKGDVFQENLLSYDENDGNSQGISANYYDSNATVQSRIDTHEGRNGNVQGKSCIPLCKQNEIYQDELDEHKSKEDSSQLHEDNNQGRRQIDQAKNKMFLNKNYSYKEKKNRNYQMKKYKVQEENNIRLYRDNKENNMYHDKSYNEQGMNKVPFGKTKYWMI